MHAYIIIQCLCFIHVTYFLRYAAVASLIKPAYSKSILILEISIFRKTMQIYHHSSGVNELKKYKNYNFTTFAELLNPNIVKYVYFKILPVN